MSHKHKYKLSKELLDHVTEQYFAFHCLIQPLNSTKNSTRAQSIKYADILMSITRLLICIYLCILSIKLQNGYKHYKSDTRLL